MGVKNLSIWRMQTLLQQLSNPAQRDGECHPLTRSYNEFSFLDINLQIVLRTYSRFDSLCTERVPAYTLYQIGVRDGAAPTESPHPHPIR